MNLTFFLSSPGRNLFHLRSRLFGIVTGPFVREIAHPFYG